MCGCAQMDFQAQWRVLAGLLGEGAGAADMFCRVLTALDEDVISLDIPRGPDGVRASMELKVGRPMTLTPLDFYPKPYDQKES